MALVKCKKCSSEVSDKFESCLKCGVPIFLTEYNALPWYRKGHICGVLIFCVLLLEFDIISFDLEQSEDMIFSIMKILSIIPSIVGLILSIIPCFSMMTGGIYYNKKNEDGNLKKWGSAGKFFVIIIFLLGLSSTIINLYTIFL